MINDDLISRKKLHSMESLLMTDIVLNNPTARYILEQVLYDIEHIPAEEATPVIHSMWTFNATGSGTCQHCHRTTRNVWDYDSWMRYCPDCGARMDGGV
jgi:hypothetical protein